jgi:hypothetical protein
MAYEGTDPPGMTGRESPDSAHVSGKHALPRLFTNVRYREEGALSRTSRMGALQPSNRNRIIVA